MTDTDKPNILLIAVDSLLSTHMSTYGYPRLTTPHIDRFARGGAVFEQTFSPFIPTTSAYASMLTGRDVFGTQVVALRHKGPLRSEVRTLPEMLRDHDYRSVCVGFKGNPSSRGFDEYLQYPAWEGMDSDGRMPKAGHLNTVFLPWLRQAVRQGGRWFAFLRHMDPHSPYLPPKPFDRIFYQGDECDPTNRSMDPVRAFAPHADYFASWIPPDVTDKDYVIAQYDGALAYMDACIQSIFALLEEEGVLDQTLVVLNGDHGETLYDHDCWFDHHGIYDVCLKVPLIIRYPARVRAGARVGGYNQHKDLVPSILDLAGITVEDDFDGRSVMSLHDGREASFESSFYLTECTWMRKHGWRTPQWKLIVALEPDFHFKPEVELYNLVEDPGENVNLADERPDVVAQLKKEMEAYIARREAETGLPNPVLSQPGWHKVKGIDYFTSSQQAYDNLHLGSRKQASGLQAKQEEKGTGK